jgi:hypothetical protein
MYRRSHVVIPRSTTHLTKRWAQPFFRRKLLHATRVLWPTFVPLTFSSVAHAQGTMDFSGAQTLMGTFNVRTPAVQIEVQFADILQTVTEQTVCAFQCQRVIFRNFEQSSQGGVLVGTR